MAEPMAKRLQTAYNNAAPCRGWRDFGLESLERSGSEDLYYEGARETARKEAAIER